MRDRIIKVVDAVDGLGGSIGVVIVTLALWAGAGYLAHRPGASSHLDRFCAGIFMAAYAMGGGTIVKNAWRWFQSGGTWQTLKISAWDLVTWGIATVAICFAGVVSWYVGWNGKTGTDYGLGVFVSTFIYDWSIGRYLENTRHAVAP